MRGVVFHLLSHFLPGEFSGTTYSSVWRLQCAPPMSMRQAARVQIPYLFLSSNPDLGPGRLQLEMVKDMLELSLQLVFCGLLYVYSFGPWNAE